MAKFCTKSPSKSEQLRRPPHFFLVLEAIDSEEGFLDLFTALKHGDAARLGGGQISFVRTGTGLYIGALDLVVSSRNLESEFWENTRDMI